MATRPNAQVGQVTTIQFDLLSGKQVLTSAGSNGTLRFGDYSLKELLRLEIGEPIRSMAWVAGNRLVVTAAGGLALFKFPTLTLESAKSWAA